MTLGRFVEEKLKELGKTESTLINDGVVSAMQMKRIRHGGSIQNSTKQRLAEALKCSIGDINNALADTPHPLRKEAEKPEGNPCVKVLKSAIREAEAEPQEVFRPEPMPEDDFPVYRSVYDEDREEGARNYRKHLKDIIIKTIAEYGNPENVAADLYADIGLALVKEINNAD